MSRFTNDQLQTFMLVVEYGTFEAAADLLRISPSAVSQRIKAMEQAAGHVLLKRTNPVTPTETGRIVLRTARQLTYLTDELENELGAGGGDRSITLAVNADSLATWFLDAVASLARENRIFCDLRREGEQYSSALLRAGETMAAITSNPESIPGCSVEKLGVEKYWVVSSTEYAHKNFANWPESIALDQLNRAPVVEYDRKDVGQNLGRSLILEEFKISDERAGQAPSVYVPSSPDYARAVLAGIGWGIVPEQQCRADLEAGRLVKLARKPIEISLFWQRWKIESEVLDTVTQKVRAAAERAFA